MAGGILSQSKRSRTDKSEILLIIMIGRGGPSEYATQIDEFPFILGHSSFAQNCQDLILHFHKN